jgi:peptidyl-prolyl cis-trans isomerase SurA
MKFSRALAALLALSVIFGALAQGLRAPGGSPLGSGLPSVREPAPAAGGTAVPPDLAGSAGGSRSSDFIVAVVNSEPITNLQVRAEMDRARRQLLAQRQPVPDAQILARQVLDQMIDERAQLQLARDSGIRVDDPSVDQAEKMIATQNDLTLEQLRQQLAKDGMDPTRFREQLRDQLQLTRLREREVDPRVRVTDADVDQYLAEQRERAGEASSQMVNIAQILVAVPDGATDAQVAELQDKARKALERARGGDDFAALAREYSDAADRDNGGALGLRTGDRYPALFMDAVQSLPVGGVTGPVRSGAGFHVLKLLERRQAGLPPTTVNQTHARHILLIPGKQINEAQARDRLNDFRRRIVSGEADFATLARQNSQDGSAAQGGDLGWVSPGMFVPEFERVMDQLRDGQISEPLISRFGVHLIQVLERRTANVSERDQREMIRNRLREKKRAEAQENWAREVRARAYIELRDAPLD